MEDTTNNTQLTSHGNDIHNPYYLHPGENPGAALVNYPLDGTNYYSWSRAIRRALKSKNNYKVVDGSIPKPLQSDPSYDIWERCNTMVISWITKCLSPQISQCIVFIEDAQDFWLDLKERFSKGDYFQISDLLQDVHSIKQGER
ncbi:PREDICTED: uncharacterized protein LOC109341540 [Lupinus angustifolius]|uniref:uncharacterized protein LOC109341540 n=1 Tax=Lupinus angustifolius TaxID=3871 RepID=UPI00092E929C|nr:PREDICTED: uncharacterized protein LOC109341540 [Lupinus angustifolius]